MTGGGSHDDSRGASRAARTPRLSEVLHAVWFPQADAARDARVLSAISDEITTRHALGGREEARRPVFPAPSAQRDQAVAQAMATGLAQRRPRGGSQRRARRKSVGRAPVPFARIAAALAGCALLGCWLLLWPASRPSTPVAQPPSEPLPRPEDSPGEGLREPSDAPDRVAPPDDPRDDLRVPEPALPGPRTLAQEYAVRFAAARHNPDALRDLRLWCRDHGLHAEARELDQLAQQTAPPREPPPVRDSERPAPASDRPTAGSVPPSWLAHFGTSPLYAATERCEVWLQPPARGSESELRTQLERIAARIDTYARDFVTRHRERLGLAAGAAADRLRVAVFTINDSYCAMCQAQGMPLAHDQAGLVLGDHSVALLRPQGELASEVAPFYDAFLMAAYLPQAVEASARVLWQAPLDLQARWGELLHVEQSDRFLVTSAPEHASLALGAAQKIDALVGAMKRLGLIGERALDNMATLALCGTPERYRDAINRRPPRTPAHASWAGTFEPGRLIWLAETLYIEDLLYAAGWTLLYHATGRVPADAEKVWLQAGLAHLVAGEVLEPARGVHPRWAPHFVQFTEAGRALPLQQFLALDRVRAAKLIARREVLDTQLQAQSWALAHYLMYGAGGAHRVRLIELVKAVVRGPLSDDAALQVLHLKDRAQLERDVAQHVRSLLP